MEAGSRPMTITQLHYTAWPDHGVPDNVMSLIGFIRHIRKVHPVSQQQPLLVHCSAGVGRTGTLILLDIIMQQMKAEGSISVHQCLRNMRMQRMKMVQSLVSGMFFSTKSKDVLFQCVDMLLSLEMHMTALETMTSNHPFIKHPHVNLIFHTITATVRVHPLWSEGAGGVWGD